MSQKNKSLVEQLDALPPFVCYNLALKTATMKELSSRCGIPVRTLLRLGGDTSYRNYQMKTVDAFLSGCGVAIGRRVIPMKLIKQRLSWVLKCGFPKMNASARRRFDEKCRKVMG